MFRKPRKPAPFFRMPGAPFNPATGERAPLGRYATRGTTLATFQVIGDFPPSPEHQDTHANYIVCRGYDPDADPHFRHLYDPYTGPASQSINVAKPYALRGNHPYVLGQIVIAARIRTKLGNNQGVASESTGHPADLDEAIEILLDDGDVAVQWLDISTQPAPHVWGKLNQPLNQGSSANINPIVFDGGAFKVDTSEEIEVYDIILNDGESVDEGFVVRASVYEGLYVVDTIYCAANDALGNL